MPEPVETRRVEDPRAIRALAHPARMAIIDALATGQELTATQCAELTGLSPSATQYHLKFLERYGLAEPAAERSDRRERPWRAGRQRIQYELVGSTPAGSAASAAVAGAHFDSTRAIGLEFARNGYSEPEEWWGGAALSNSDLWLTADEFRELGDQLRAVMEPYREREQRGERLDGSRRVRVMNVIVPHSRPPE